MRIITIIILHTAVTLMSDSATPLSNSSEAQGLTTPMRMEPRVVLDSHKLLQGENEVLIQHGSEVYRLRHTRNGKLILTK
ncbi:MAG: hemin uptake protein HemP [Thermomonas sp.]|nr:hemin uptake protein HemP [Thermomonas sp.]